MGAERSAWQKYDRIQPEITQCLNDADALKQARLYHGKVQGREIISHHGYSMSNLYGARPPGRYSVVEPLPFDQAGGYASAFINPTNPKMTVCHFLIARDKAGKYVSMGDSPTNPERDAWRVAPEHYKGVIKRVFTFPR